MTTAAKLLVTYALPYANGSIHLGHLVGFIQTDIWARFQKLRGRECHFVCGDDAHGTPVMIKADKEGISPEQFSEKMYQEHKTDLSNFHIDFDNFHTTHSDENHELATLIYQRLAKRGDIERRTIEHAFDPEKKMFLPDRYVKGECPRCGAIDQYGDNCEVCGATYSPMELLNPKSILSGATPELRKTDHFFFKLQDYTDMLKNWTHAGHLQKEVANKLNEWFEQGLRSWDITRDAPYFGFKIPGTEDKYFYVWLDAPVGYMASFKNYCDNNPLIEFEDYWGKDSPNELYHFIGKDIIYFHSLFWPAILHGSSFRTPTGIYAHGFLTINGEKMSKSRGTFISGKTFLEHLPAEYLRYYFAAKLNSHLDDIDFNFEDFKLRVNADLIGKVINIASRCARFINKHFDNQCAKNCLDELLHKLALDTNTIVADYFENREYARAVRVIMDLADKVNKFIDKEKPWVLIKQEEQADRVQAICTMGLELFRIIMLYLKPILPQLAEKVEDFLQIPPLSWQRLNNSLFGETIGTFKPLLQRIEQQQIEQLQK